MKSKGIRIQALTEAKANDLLFWASRYHLFVHWSANRAHPWDSLPKSDAACAILEIGKLRNSDGEVRPALTSTMHITACMQTSFSAWLNARMQPCVLGRVVPVHPEHD